ncbi:hypothetical protein PG996_007231 [Apiospora saccharicola]|uniref:Fungal N-terminal domain-containing protein n=1 Tax=Apiospora saccharicola TaxID=335842 RepID=A0ABR1VDN6_9PEZI
MDPLSALSLAGTIVQFVSFSGELLSTTTTIYESTTGEGSDITNLAAISNRLRTFGNEFENGQMMLTHIQAIRDLSEIAKPTANTWLLHSRSCILEMLPKDAGGAFVPLCSSHGRNPD